MVNKMFKFTIIDKILIVLLLVGVLGVFNIYFFHYNYEDMILNLGEKEIKRVSNVLISEAVSSEIEAYDNDFFVFNDKSELSTLSFDSIKLTNLSNNIIKYINDDLFFNKINVFELPIGFINNNLLLNISGPNIPVCFRYFGETKCELKCVVDDYSINTVIVKIVLDIDMNAQMILPLMSKNIEVNNSYPIVIELLQGEIPDIMFGNYPVVTSE